MAKPPTLESVLSYLQETRLEAQHFQTTTEQTLRRLERMIHNATPPSRRADQPGSTVQIVHDDTRKQAMLRNFEALVNLPRQRKIALKFPDQITQPVKAVVGTTAEQDFWRICVRSVLLNRCSLRKSFAPNFAAGEVSSLKCAEETLQALCDDGTLSVATIDALTHSPRHSSTLVVYDPTAVPERFTQAAAREIEQEIVQKEEDTMARRLEALAQETPEQKRARLVREYGEDYVKQWEGPDDEDGPTKEEIECVAIAPEVVKPNPFVNKLVWPKAADDDDEDAEPMKIDTTPDIVDTIIEDEPKAKKKKRTTGGNWTL